MTEEELFDSIAKGDIASLMAAFPSRCGPHDRAGRGAKPCLRCLPEGASALSVQGLWTQLHVRLLWTTWECAKPDAIGRLAALGIRRPRTVVLSLAREYVKAQSMATVAGFKPHPQDVSQLAREPSHYDNLDDNFRGLAENYQLIMQAMEPLSETLLYRWLRGRAMVHFAQAEAIRRGT
jgi:hypothetical protein